MLELERELLRNNGLTFPLIKNKYIYTQKWALSWVIQDTKIGNNPKIRELQKKKKRNDPRIRELQ